MPWQFSFFSLKLSGKEGLHGQDPQILVLARILHQTRIVPAGTELDEVREDHPKEDEADKAFHSTLAQSLPAPTVIQG